MNAFLHHVAGAALPVAFGLLILAATARAALWADLDDRRTRLTAARYLGPLSTWCMVAVAVYIVALGAAGAAGLPALALALGLCAAALAVRLSTGEDEPAPAAPAPAPATPAPTTSPPAGDPRGLWDEPAAGEQRSGLWSR